MRLRMGLFLALVLFASAAHPAGIPVIDSASLANLLKQVEYAQQQLQRMSEQLNQAKAAYSAITGGRGMEALAPLSNLGRNYLPPTYSDTMSILNKTGTLYSNVSNQLEQIQVANAILSRSNLSQLSKAERAAVENGRQAAALLQTVAAQGQQFTSQRFTALQGLNTAIGSATDPKAIADLQARIAAEQTMLTADQTKLQAMYQLAQAQELQRKQAVREGLAAGFADPSNSFHPTFPSSEASR